MIACRNESSEVGDAILAAGKCYSGSKDWVADKRRNR
jgi:hypothetical protein